MTRGAFPNLVVQRDSVAVSTVFVDSLTLNGSQRDDTYNVESTSFGTPVTLSNRLSAPARAYIEAARRLQGEDVSMTVPRQKRGLLDKLFGRRAA